MKKYETDTNDFAPFMRKDGPKVVEMLLKLLCLWIILWVAI